MSARHILVVDDEPDIRNLVQEILEDEGYTVTTADCGEAARKAGRTRRPDLILLDLMMPVMHGFEFMERLRADQATCAVPVVVLTAKELSMSEREFLTAHAQRIVQKGAGGAEALLPLVRRAVAEYRERAG